MQIKVTSNEAESVLGDATANIQRYGLISLSGAEAVGGMKHYTFSLLANEVKEQCQASWKIPSV